MKIDVLVSSNHPAAGWPNAHLVLQGMTKGRRLVGQLVERALEKGATRVVIEERDWRDMGQPGPPKGPE